MPVGTPAHFVPSKCIMVPTRPEAQTSLVPDIHTPWYSLPWGSGFSQHHLFGVQTGSKGAPGMRAMSPMNISSPLDVRMSFGAPPISLSGDMPSSSPPSDSPSGDPPGSLQPIS